MTDNNVSSLVLKKGSNRYIFDPSSNLDLSNYYTKSEADGKYALKTDLSKYSLTTHTHSQYATTSAVTNAQNTANNALNVANSKSSFNISTRNYETLNLTNSFTPKFRCFCLLKNSGDSTVTITQNGYNVFAYEFNQNYPDTFVPLEAKITTLSAHSSGRYCAL